MKKTISYIIFVVAVLVSIYLIKEVFLKNGTGFSDYTDGGGVFHAGKTLWDWLDLLVIPVSLSIFAIVINKAEKDNQASRELDRQREEALRDYFDHIERLLSVGLKEGREELKNIARSRTLSTFRMLDGQRKGTMLLFLYNLGLISRVDGQSKPLVDLTGADLTGLIISYKHERNTRNRFSYSLQNIDLSDLDLRFSRMSCVYFFKANLDGSDLSFSTFDNLWFNECNLNANFNRSKINHTNFQESRLIESTFVKAKVINSDFQFSQLYYLSMNTNYKNDQTDFTNANLTNSCFGCHILPDQLRKAKVLKNIVLPTGNIYDGPDSLPKILLIPDPPTEEELNNTHSIGRADAMYRMKIECYCSCGEKISPIKLYDLIDDYWWGFAKHRIEVHNKKLTEVLRLGFAGRPLIGIINRMLEDEKNNKEGTTRII